VPVVLLRTRECATNPSPPPLSPSSPPPPQIERQLKGLTDGTLQPEDVRIPGNDWAYSSASAGANAGSGSSASSSSASAPLVPAPAFAAANARAAARAASKAAEEAAERERSRALQAKWDAERAERLSREERDKWWTFARLQYGEDGVNAPESIAAAAAGAASTVAPSRSGLAYRGPIDYTWWDKWADCPDDPTSKEEREREVREKQKADDDAFERANPGFASMVKGDIDKRAVAEQKKIAKAASLKDKGNVAFQAKNYPAAFAAYHDALKAHPFSVPVLNNIAACHIALGNDDGAVEFTSRVLFIEKYATPAGVKAHFRRAHAYGRQGRLTEAEADLARARIDDPASAEVAAELARVRLQLAEVQKEAEAAASAAAAVVAESAGGAAGAGAAAGKAADLPTRLARAAAGVAAAVAAASTPAPAEASGAASASSTTPDTSPSSTSGEELRSLAAALDSDSKRVLARTSGLLVALTSAVAGTVKGLVAAAAAEASVPPGSLPPLPLPLDGLDGAFLALAACADNAKNRVMIRGGALPGSPVNTGSADGPAPLCGLSSALDFLSISDEAAVLAASRAPSPAGTRPATPAQLIRSLRAVRMAAYALLQAYLNPRAQDAEGRAAAASHPFVKGWWRAQLAASPAGGAGGAAPPALPGPLPFLAAVEEVSHVDIIARVRGFTRMMMTEIDLPAGVVEEAAEAASALQFLAAAAPKSSEPEAAAPLNAAVRAKPQVDINAPHVEAHAAIMSGFSVADGPAQAAGGASAASPLPGPGPRHPVPALLQLVTILIGRSVFDGEPILTSGLMQCAVGALANFAATESLRPAFIAPAVQVAEPPQSAAGKAAGGAKKDTAAASVTERVKQHAKETRAKSTRKVGAAAAAAPSAASAAAAATTTAPSAPNPPALHPLLDLQRIPVPPSIAWDVVRGSALGALSNACVGSEPAAACLVSSGAVDVLLGVLDDASSAAAAAGAAPPSMNPEVRSRTALLLGRLSGTAGAVALTEPGTVGRVTRWLGESLAAPANATASPALLAAAVQYQDGLVRLLAGITDPTACESIVAAGGVKILVAFLRAALPTLRPSTANGMRARAAAVGNACRVFIGFSSLPSAPSAVLAAGGCDVLVDALKSAGDAETVPVRKNAAVALARLAKDPGCIERIRELRGMEMLIQVNSQLLK
jgi:tetratricopeptide (TPR) repeat protein